MKIRLRLFLLLGCLLAVFAAAWLLLKESHRREAANIRATVEEQRNELLDRLLVLTGQSLQTFAGDYSLWDDMAAFLENPDPAWARVNLDASLANFAVRAVSVWRLDGRPVYHAGDPAAATLATAPFADAAFRARLARERNLHFFAESPGGLLEVRTAPIQPSADEQRVTPPLGWLVVVRLWNEEHLRTLASALQSDVAFSPPPATPGDPAEIHLQRELSDWTGRPVRTLHVDYQSLALSRLLQGNQDETFVLLLFGLAMIAVTGFGLTRWVLAPLRQLGRSLESGEPAALAGLQGEKNEFGHLARLVQESFDHRAALEREVAARSRLAHDLQDTDRQLRESIELRSRLARDLHDGIIQSIYAAGLGLEGVRSTLHTDPTRSDRRLAGCQTALNDTIRDVRTFINGLEAEDIPSRPFRQTLATLVTTMQSIQPGDISLKVDEAVAARIGPAQELQILQILRESISNALRHAAPCTIHLALARADNGAVLTVTDDGSGFDPAQTAGHGHGLTNLGIRAREMGGTFHIDSAPGHGTRLTLLFNPTYPP